ncbi:MAG: excinuclease ABC subunit UvrA [Deltaproteobacteria bacterium]|nr:excinuclease ABC subunit UvrA [Deltaproteobacteria bacterium]
MTPVPPRRAVSGSIVVRGAREHNLQNIHVTLPRDRLVVITGVSGSGKSSLAFDTIYAEGQRRYVESLSAYARQFLDQMNKPDVDSIEGLSPAISIEQKTTSNNPRSTVGTVTELYDYFRLLYARIGQPACPDCGRPVSRQTVQQIVDQILGRPEGTKVVLLAPIVRGRKGEYRKELENLRKEGFNRVRIDGDTRELSEPIALDKKRRHDIDVDVERLVAKPGAAKRVAESVELGLRVGDGLLRVQYPSTGEEEILSEKLACIECGISLPEIEPRTFSFNSPHGACPKCTGLGELSFFDPERVIPDPTRSLEGGAVAPFASKMMWWGPYFDGLAKHFGVSTKTPWKDLPASFREIILNGTDEDVKFVWKGDGSRYSFTKRFEGVMNALERRLKETTSENVRDDLSEYTTLRACPECGGARLRREARVVRVGGLSIDALTALSVRDCVRFFEGLELEMRERSIAERILKEIAERLGFLARVGLDYLTLDRRAGTLSGGESQRIRLATQIGRSLVGVLYILDEPSIGLHQRDNQRLLSTLTRLRDIGNTVLVVEHDDETIEAADWVVDMGPGAGQHGGQVVSEGTPAHLKADPKSLTGKYLSGALRIEVPAERRVSERGFVTIRGATGNNLKSVDARFPLGVFTCVTGVSGSGKSTLVTETLYKGLSRALNGAHDKPAPHAAIEGLEALDKVIDIDQTPIGRTPRSNPATYTQLFGEIRDVFANLPEAKIRGYKAGRFSFNVKGGRCEACEGGGILRIEMHFLPDIFVKCEVCDGRRYNRETLDICYRGKSIADVLEMPVSEALSFLGAHPSIQKKLQTLEDVGLGYIRLGQQATTLSGGEAQRVKLAKELSRRATGRTVYILDEPTTGLHFADIQKLLEVLHRLVDQGNTVIVIEHNLDVIKTADWVIDLGPEGGDAGGCLVAVGTPEDVAAVAESHTGHFLRRVLAVVEDGSKRERGDRREHEGRPTSKLTGGRKPSRTPGRRGDAVSRTTKSNGATPPAGGSQ